MELCEKLYIARTVLLLNQKKVAEEAGINSVIISVLESGERNAVPEAYANFLYQRGIDLNWLFNKDDNAENVFRKEKYPNKTHELLNNIEHEKMFINTELLETKKLTNRLMKHFDKLLDEVSEIKKLYKELYIKFEKGNSLN